MRLKNKEILHTTSYKKFFLIFFIFKLYIIVLILPNIKISDETVFVGHVLDVAGQDLDAQLLHVLAGLHHHLIGEAVSVGVDGLQGQGADDLTHIAL